MLNSTQNGKGVSDSIANLPDLVLTSSNNIPAQDIPSPQSVKVMRESSGGPSVDALCQVAADMLTHGQAKLAADYCSLAIRQQPDPRAYKLLGDSLQQLQSWTEAEQAYRQSLQLDPKQAETYANLGSLYAQQRQWLKALSCYQKTLALKPGLSAIEQNIDRIWQQIRQSDDGVKQLYEQFVAQPQQFSASSHLRLGEILLERHQEMQAIVCYRQALQLEPNLPTAKQRLEQMARQMQSGSAKVAAVQPAARPDVSSQSSPIQAQPVQTASHSATVTVPTTTPTTAPASSVRVVKRSTIASIEPLLSQGAQYMQQQQWQQALSCYEQAVSLHPNHAPAQWQLATVLDHLNQKDRAIDHYFQSLSLDHSSVSAADLCNFGNILKQRQQFDRAVRCYEWAIQKDEKLLEAYSQLGETQYQQENYELAVTNYRKAIEIQATGQNYHNLGDAFLKLDKWEEAVEAYRRSINLQPDFSWSYNNLADALMQLTRWESAAKAYERAIELNPEFHWSHYNLGEAFAKLGRWDQAIASFHHALKLEPRQQWVEDKVGASYFNEGVQKVLEGKIKEANLCFSKVEQIGDAQGDLLHWFKSQNQSWPHQPLPHLKSIFESLKPKHLPWPKITIVTPSLNQGHYIEETILSVLHQDYDNLEYIVLDGKSEDNTVDVLDRYRARITQVIIEADNGQSSAINKGFRLGTGELMTWLNSDDLLAPGALYVAALTYLERNWDLAAGICVMHQDHQILTVRKPRIKSQNFTVEHLADVARLWTTGHFFFQPEIIFTRRIWEKTGAALDESLNYAMDYDLWMRFAQCGARLEIVSWPLAFFRKHPAQKTANQSASVQELVQTTQRYHVIEPRSDRRQEIGSTLINFLRLPKKRVLVIQSSQANSEVVRAPQTLTIGNYDLVLCSTLDQVSLQSFNAVLLIVDSLQAQALIANLRQSEFAGLYLAWFWNHYQNFENHAVIADWVDVCIPSQALLADTLRSYFSVLSPEVPVRDDCEAAASLAQLSPFLESIWRQIDWTALELQKRMGNGSLAGTTIGLPSPAQSVVRSPLHPLPTVGSSPKPELVYIKMAEAYAAAQDLEAAIKAYQTALDLNPNLTEIRAKLNQTVIIHQGEVEKQNSPKVAPWPYSPVLKHFPPTLPDGNPWPKISIVTPSFNQGAFIEETILSVIHQGYPNVEHILIDGGSTDNTMQIVDRYRDHFSYIVSERDKGQSNALNKGFQRASGEIFTWLNSDDRLAPGALYAVALAFYTSSADVVAGVCQLFKDGIEIEQHLTSCVDGVLPLDDLLEIERYWLKGKFFYQPEVMFSRTVWEKAGGFVDESLFYSMDYELWTRFAAAGAQLHVIGSPIAQYRMHAEQKTSAVDKYEPELRQTSDSLRLRFKHLVSKLDQVPELKETNAKGRLRIALLNDVGAMGGAGIAHTRIGQALALAGHEVIPIAGTLDWDLTPVDSAAAEVFQKVVEASPDLVVVGNLHNMEQALNILELLTDRFYTIFVMHDQWLLTGRCAYVGTCEKYMTACDAACPTSDQYPRLAPEKIADAFHRKHALLSKSDRLLVLGDSRWTTNWARYAFLSTQPRQIAAQLDHQFQTLYYGLDLEMFRPRDPVECRKQLGLPIDRFIILTGCQSIEDERKGFKYLIEALRIAKLENVLLVSFGYGSSVVDGIEVYSAGYVQHPLVLASYYCAADIFVGPSQEEAFGQTFIEAAACGTPTVGYELGGVKEAITAGVTGLTVVSRTPEALAEAIAELYHNRERRQLLSALAPIHVASHFSFQSSYHSFMVALTQSGWLNTLQMNPASKFFAQVPELAQPMVIKGEAQVAASILVGSGVTGQILSGFSEVEPPYPHLGLDKPSQWLLYPQADFALIAPETQSGKLVIDCRNVSPAQRLEIWQGEQLQVRGQLPYSDILQPNRVVLSVVLYAGVNKFILKVNQYHTDESQRALGILVQQIRFDQAASAS